MSALAPPSTIRACPVYVDVEENVFAILIALVVVEPLVVTVCKVLVLSIETIPVLVLILIAISLVVTKYVPSVALVITVLPEL